MNPNFVALTSLISFTGLTIVVFWVIRDFYVDSFRQKMFALRDELFDESTNGVIPFDSNAYKMLRMTMNGLIRFGHRISLTQVVALSLFAKHAIDHIDRISFDERFESSLKELTSNQRDLLRDYRARMNFTVGKHLLVNSPLLIVTVIVPIVIAVAANGMVHKTLKILRDPIDNLDSMARAEGDTGIAC